MRNRDDWTIKPSAIGSIEEERYSDLERAGSHLHAALRSLDHEALADGQIGRLSVLGDAMADAIERKKADLEAVLAEEQAPLQRPAAAPANDALSPTDAQFVAAASQLRLGADYVRIVDRRGEELLYWDRAEFSNCPSLLDGILYAAIGHGVEVRYELICGEGV